MPNSNLMAIPKGLNVMFYPFKGCYQEKKLKAQNFVLSGPNYKLSRATFGPRAVCCACLLQILTCKSNNQPWRLWRHSKGQAWLKQINSPPSINFNCYDDDIKRVSKLSCYTCPINFVTKWRYVSFMFKPWTWRENVWVRGLLRVETANLRARSKWATSGWPSSQPRLTCTQEWHPKPWRTIHELHKRIKCSLPRSILN